ncbi:hypothetical protein MUP46_03700 [Patescibacteria group bacterium]|nr:hypothetical protein [Patescibacteria group bacterium]
MKIQYQTYKFRNGTISTIEKTNEIIAEYTAEGYELTLRQLYYQFVARGFIENTEREYKQLGSIIDHGRLAGEIDWLAIVDRTREIKQKSHWDSPAEILQSAAGSYALDSRADQPVHIEAWVEKEALAGVLERACGPLDVAYFACKGYVSQSAMWRAAARISDKLKARQCTTAVILYLGDHDPSGIDMSRDVQARLDIFGTSIAVRRVALNLDQVEQYNPPANPAKVTDSRCAAYIAEYGNESWELDALDPRTINELVSREINGLTNLAARRRLIKKQEKHREKLQKIADNFEDLSIQ